jgi:hypothetical protein
VSSSSVTHSATLLALDHIKRENLITDITILISMY